MLYQMNYHIKQYKHDINLLQNLTYHTQNIVQSCLFSIHENIFIP